jgi:polyisoprenoid-binding protein YceI
MTTETTTRPFAGGYAADPVHSSFGFALTHMGVSTFRGSFSDVRASLESGPDGIALQGAAKVESISIVDPPEFRAHVLSAEFFDAESHPEIAFSSSAVALDDDGSAEIDGELTIKGITKPVHATGSWVAPREALGGMRGALELEATVDRRDFGMNWQLELPGGGNAAEYEITISAHLELLQSPEGEA